MSMNSIMKLIYHLEASGQRPLRLVVVPQVECLHVAQLNTSGDKSIFNATLRLKSEAQPSARWRCRNKFNLPSFLLHVLNIPTEIF